MSEEAIDGIDLRGSTPSVRQAKKGPLALVAMLVLIVLLAMAYALYQRSHQKALGGDSEDNYQRKADLEAAAALTAKAPEVILPAIDRPAPPPEPKKQTPAPPPQPAAAPVAHASPKRADPAEEERRKRLARARAEAIEASMEVPLGIVAGLAGVNPANAFGSTPAPSAGNTDPRMAYMNALKSALGGKGDVDPNGQAGKAEFIQTAQQIEPPMAITGPQPPASPYVIRTGTVIPMVLIGGMNSDLPGMVIAQVSQDVYDTPLGRYLLIPQGTRLVGKYDSRIAYGQNRLLVVWDRLIFPDGSALEIGGMPGADQGAYAGMHDQVDNHYFRIFGSALLLSVISAGFEIATNTDQQVTTTSDTAREAIARQMAEAASNVLQKNLNIQPTIVIRNGAIGTVMVNKDLYLKPWRPS